MFHGLIPSLALFASLIVGVGCTSNPPSATLEAVTTVTTDGLTIYGEPYLGGLGGEAPMILLFHQGGSNGRGEYSELAPWLNDLGYRVVAWDQRTGGNLHGSSNRTVAGLLDPEAFSYCDAYEDLEAALAYVTSSGLAREVIVWGSSYSGALAFQLAAKHPEVVRAVLAFSPASGPQLADCLARDWLDRIAMPAHVFRPSSEMQRPTSFAQREHFTAAGVQFTVLENGVHGSSMLVDDRTGSDMNTARAVVSGWLSSALGVE